VTTSCNQRNGFNAMRRDRLTARIITAAGNTSAARASSPMARTMDVETSNRGTVNKVINRTICLTSKPPSDITSIGDGGTQSSPATSAITTSE